MQSLAVKYRPKEWEDCIEQSTTLTILQQEIIQNRIKNCYLFCGSSGCGKTTTARLFAHKINKNKGSPIEIDAASNNGVDNIRNIIKAAQERSIDSEYKVFVIDECHVISSQGWQAFLKCIEEPPQFTIFIFCTTDPQKIPDTILNRVERFNFTRISNKGIEKRLQYICEQEHFTNYAESIKYISKLANGGMRDAIALLEKCASFSTDLSITTVVKVLGVLSYDTMFKIINAFIDGDEKIVLLEIENYYNNGNDLKVFIEQFTSFVLDIAKYNIFKDMDLLKIPSTYEDSLKRTISIDKADKYFLYVLDKLLNLKVTLKSTSDVKSDVEITFIHITRCK